jgi:hypothetical protein
MAFGMQLRTMASAAQGAILNLRMKSRIMLENIFPSKSFGLPTSQPNQNCGSPLSAKALSQAFQ